VQRQHERLFRDLAKQQEDDREQRLEALRANDFEAYQELLVQQQVCACVCVCGVCVCVCICACVYVCRKV
jgi:hypothetical protein